MPVAPSARFQVIQVPLRAPGNCFVCKTTIGPFVETGLRHDFWREAPDPTHDGDVIICAACVRSMAENLTLDDVTVEKKVDDARRAGFVEGVLHGKRVLDEFALGFIDSSLSLSSVVGPNQRIVIEDNAEDEPTELFAPSKATKAAGQSDGAGDVEGRDNVPGDSIDGDNLFGVA